MTAHEAADDVARIVRSLQVSLSTAPSPRPTMNDHQQPHHRRGRRHPRNHQVPQSSVYKTDNLLPMTSMSARRRRRQLATMPCDYHANLFNSRHTHLHITPNNCTHLRLKTFLSRSKLTREYRQRLLICTQEILLLTYSLCQQTDLVHNC